MENFETNGHKTQSPCKLEINNETWYFDKDKLFEKLINYEGQEIKVIHKGARTDTKNYIIYKVDLFNRNGPLIDLRDII